MLIFLIVLVTLIMMITLISFPVRSVFFFTTITYYLLTITFPVFVSAIIIPVIITIIT